MIDVEVEREGMLANIRTKAGAPSPRVVARQWRDCFTHSNQYCLALILIFPFNTPTLSRTRCHHQTLCSWLVAPQYPCRSTYFHLVADINLPNNLTTTLPQHAGSPVWEHRIQKTEPYTASFAIHSYKLSRDDMSTRYHSGVTALVSYSVWGIFRAKPSQRADNDLDIEFAALSTS
jgi:hypothetical protein